jgi:hypothetical protein
MLAVCDFHAVSSTLLRSALMATMAVEKVSGLSIARLRSLLHERLVFKRWLSAAHVAEQLFWGSPGNQRESISLL